MYQTALEDKVEVRLKNALPLSKSMCFISSLKIYKR